MANDVLHCAVEPYHFPGDCVLDMSRATPPSGSIFFAGSFLETHCYNRRYMKNKSARARLPAKFVGPDVGQAVNRPRLFELIEAQNAACLWVHGPPGSGKTTLVASYLQVRKLRPIWYQLDTDDREPSTFFHFLATGIKASIPARHKLPVAEAETRDDWIGFARRFFRAMLAGLAEDDVLVFENVHEGGGALDEVFALLVAEAASGQRVIFTSHHPPAAAFVDVIAKRQLAELNADALRFDLAEARALLATIAGSQAAEADIEKLQTLTEGWAAGIVLLASQPLAELKLDGAKPASRSRLFEYFSRMVIEKLPAESRAVVEACAFLPDFNAELAITVSGNPDAAIILESLHRSGLFVEMRLIGKSPVFQFHALLAEALRDHVGVAGSVKWRQAMMHAGRMLAASGRIEASIPLLIAGGDVVSAAAQILAIAETNIAEDRLEQLANWITQLPEAIRANMPWLDYWLGLSLAPIDESAARAILAAVFSRFEQSDDRLGCVQCASAILLSIELGWQSFEGIEHWRAQLRSNWSDNLVFYTPESELRVFAGLLASRFGTKPTAEELVSIPNRAVALIQQARDVNAQLLTAMMMIQWFMNARDQERAILFENFIADEVRVDRARPLQRATWHWMLSLMNSLAAQVLQRPLLSERGKQHRHLAEQIAGAHELAAMKISIVHAEAERCILARDVAGLRAALDSIESKIQPGRVGQMIWHLNRRAQLAILDARPKEAWPAISHVLQLIEQAHYPENIVSAYYDIAANVLLHLGRFDEALAHNARALQNPAEGHRQNFEMNTSFIHAIWMLDGGAWNAQQVKDFFTTIRDKRLLDFGRLLDRPLARLGAAALAHDIETEFVRELVLHRKFPPPNGAPSNWPWPLKIEALGSFKVSIADVVQVFEGKSQKKPLELLQLIVTLQDSFTGTGPKMQQVMDELWPSLEAKDPQGSFDTTLHRLRKLINVEGAIVVADGRLSLNRALVWCDVAAFEMLAKTSLPDDARALELYAGALLDSTVYSWSAAPRERLAAVYTGLVERCASRLEGSGDYKAAIGLYERALQQDNLIEPFYRGLMRCHHARGENTEALRMYRRCRELLSIVLSTLPSPETEALRLKLAT